MKTTAIVVALAVIAMSVPAQAAPMVSNHDWWINHYESRIAELVKSDIALPAEADEVEELLANPDFAEHIETLAARADALGINLHALTSGAGESGGFPLVGDSLFISEWFNTVPAPASASCNQVPATGSGGHYDNIYLNGPVTTDPGWGMIFVGDATSTFGTTAGTYNVALQLPAGTFGGIPLLGVPAPKAFLFGDDISYVAESDFWCYSQVFCFFGFCYYIETNYPYLRGLTTVQ